MKFTITPKANYLFQPTHVSFKATRFGTGHGKFQSYWLYDDESRTEVAVEQLANRDNGENGAKYSTIDTDIQGKSTSKASSLVIHLYDIPYNTNTKYVGLADVVISGKVGSSTSGISTISDITNVAPVYYNLKGQRVESPTNGAYIRVSYGADGKRMVRKVIVK